MPRGFGHYFRAIAPAQETRAMAFIKPAFDGTRESLMVFALDFKAPWLGVKA